MTTPDRRLDRRAYLGAVAAGATAVAGCTGGSDDDTRAGDGDAGSDDGDNGETGDEERPTTGDVPSELSPIDDAMLDVLKADEIPTATLAVARDGEPLLERGYGWADRDRTEPVEPDAQFRLASVTKPLTVAAVHELVESGALAYDDPFYELTDVEPAGELGDDRIEEVTIRHLLDHVGGWHRPPAEDPMFDAFTVADALDLEEPPTARDFARHLLTEPLDEEPGTDPTGPGERSYSNFGYVLLGLVIEDVSGQPFDEYVTEEILEPIDAGAVELGRTLPEDRPAEEVWYESEEECPNAAALDPDETVRCADGWLPVEALHAAGGLVGSAPTLRRFLDGYWLGTGEPRDETEQEWLFFGEFVGTFAYVHQRPDGVDLVVLCNRRVGEPMAIAGALGEAVDAVDDWP